MTTHFTYNGKRYVTATLLAIANQGALLKMPTERLTAAPGVSIDHDTLVVVAHGDQHHILAGKLTHTHRSEVPVRLLSKIILKKALVPAPVAARPYVDHLAYQPPRGWGNQSRSNEFSQRDY